MFPKALMGKLRALANDKNLCLLLRARHHSGLFMLLSHLILSAPMTEHSWDLLYGQGNRGSEIQGDVPENAWYDSKSC